MPLKMLNLTYLVLLLVGIRPAAAFVQTPLPFSPCNRYTSSKAEFSKPYLTSIYLFNKASSVSRANEDDDTEDASSSEDYSNSSGPAIRQKLGKVRAFLSSKSPYILPIVLSVSVGYRWGAKATRKLVTMAPEAGGATSAASSSSSIPAAVSSSTPRPPYLLRATVVALIAREIWGKTPVWLKRQIPFVAAASKQQQQHPEELDENDLTSLAIMSQKLQRLFLVGSEKLAASSSMVEGENDSSKGAGTQLTKIGIRAALLALVHAQNQPDWAVVRDAHYEEQGESIRLDEWRGEENTMPSIDDDSLSMEDLFELADAAYDELPNDTTLQQALAGRNFTLLRHDPLALPGCVAHYIAVCPQRKLAVISIKGTSNLEDFVTDACGNAVTYNLDPPPLKGHGTPIRCHEGALLATKRLAHDVSVLVEDLLLPTGYKLLLTGHSLGAGVASMLGLFLMSRFPSLQVETGRDRRLEVVAFAPPPVLDLDTANACSSFTTSVINNSDVIPRASLSNLIITIEWLRRINQKLEDKGMDPNSLRTTASLIKMIADGENSDALMTTEEMTAGFEEAINQVELRDPDHLYVPGRVIQMYDLWSKDDYDAKRKPTDEDTMDDYPLDERERPSERVRILEPSSKGMRFIEIDWRMLSDHMAPGYRSSIRTLLTDSAASP